MEILIGGLTSLVGGGAAAATATVPGIAGASTLVPAAATGLSLSSILQGTATVLGIVSAVGAGNAEADALELQAADAEAEKPLETLQGIARRSSIKRAFADAIGAQDVAYAASGVDLSFGTARAARTDAAREADLALDTATGTEQTRIARLSERASGYRRAAKQAKRGGYLKAALGGIDTGLSFLERG